MLLLTRHEIIKSVLVADNGQNLFMHSVGQMCTLTTKSVYCLENFKESVSLVIPFVSDLSYCHYHWLYFASSFSVFQTALADNTKEMFNTLKNRIL